MNNQLPQKPILDSYFIVSAEHVSPMALEEFKVSLKDREGNDLYFEFFSYDSGTGCYKFARGDIARLKKWWGHLEWEDRRVSIPMTTASTAIGNGYGIQFTGQLREGQQRVADFLLNQGTGSGQIKAPPRFGKTVLMSYLTCTLKQRTLFLSHQIDLAQQALRTFYNYSNLLDIEYMLGRQVAGIIEDWSDFDKFDIAFVPYQLFVSGKNADEHLIRLKNQFGVVFTDESHKGAANRYSQVISAFNPRYRWGLSGTTERKDQMHLINDFVLGPVVIEGQSEQVPCKVMVLNTGVVVAGKRRPSKFDFTDLQTKLVENSSRTQKICEKIYEWASAGHSCIAVTDRVSHIDNISNILKSWGIKTERYHRKVFRTKKDREACLDRMRSGESQVLVAYRSMTLGLDIPRLTAFFNLLPTANPPNYYQELCRIRTPYDGKNMAYIIDFADSNPIAWGCLESRMGVYRNSNFEIQKF